MNFKKILEQLNLPAQAKKQGIPLWQHPQFVFLIMGIIIIGSMIFTYTLGNHYIDDPLLVSLLVIIVTFVLFILAFIITQSFEKLAEASRMKSEFIAIASHQLKTPLTSLKWLTEFLISGETDQATESQRQYFKILKEDTERMIELIRDLLTVSKIEERQFKKEKIFLQDLLKEIIESARFSANSKNLKIKTEVEGSLPEISSDPYQLKIVIENLLDNAIRYSKEGGEINISLKKKNRDICFEIQDKGIGIPKEDQKYIFQKFFRAVNAQNYQIQGSGLGLYIAKLIINKLGGKIGFQSEENKGSTFWFNLPIK